MPLIVNFNGDIIKQSNSNDYWSKTGGSFLSSKKIITYFPIPQIYNNALPGIGTYIVPKGKENRPDLIAKELYNSEDLWWVVYWASGIIDPFLGPKVGDKITIIDINKLYNLIK